MFQFQFLTLNLNKSDKAKLQGVLHACIKKLRLLVGGNNLGFGGALSRRQGAWEEWTRREEELVFTCFQSVALANIQRSAVHIIPPLFESWKCEPQKWNESWIGRWWMILFPTSWLFPTTFSNKLKSTSSSDESYFRRDNELRDLAAMSSAIRRFSRWFPNHFMVCGE